MPDYFQPDPIEEEVSAALVRILAGETADACESQRLDFKEEPGRRDEVGEVTSEGADVKATAAMLAGAASCMSNGGGGAVVLGVADDGQLIGTSLEVDWLRQRIYEMLQRRLIVDVREMHVLSHRLLVLRVPAAVEAIPYKGAIKTRVGRMCVDYDLASWTRKIQQPRLDWSAESSGIPVSSVRAAALECGREFLRRGSDDSQLGAASDADFLRRLGAVHQDGLLTNAGALLFAERPDPALDYIRRRAPGGDSALRVRIAGTSVLEQLRDVELAFRSSNTVVHVPAGLATAQIPALPFRAFREAVVNGLAHRSWTLAEPTTVEHVGSTVTVSSPGGLPAGVTPDNIITHPSQPPNRLLAEILAKLRVAEREGIGVDRMVADMLAGGHEVPIIGEYSGPMVRVVLLGGHPNTEWLALLSKLDPPDATQNLDYLLLLKTIIETGWLDAAAATKPLQKTEAESLHALTGLASISVNNEPLLTPVRGVPAEVPPAWRASKATRKATPLATSRLTAPANRAGVALAWARARGRVSSTELADLVQTQANYAGKVLKDLQEEGLLAGSSESGMGRGYHYLPVAQQSEPTGLPGPATTSRPPAPAARHT